MELTGRVKAILAEEKGTSKSGNEWVKKSFVIETNDKFPKSICFQLFGDKAQQCPAINEDVVVSFDVQSREWNGKWFTQCDAWSVKKIGDALENDKPIPAVQAPTIKPEEVQSAGSGDLPF